MWPGLADGTSALFIDESEEPDSGDVLRIFYTTGNTISGLDSATATTLIDRDVNVLILGASGYLVQERIQEEKVYWGKRDWRDWAAERLREHGFVRFAGTRPLRAPPTVLLQCPPPNKAPVPLLTRCRQCTFPVVTASSD